MTLAEGKAGNTYKIKSVTSGDEELEDFLFTLGCYEGQDISIVSIFKQSMVVAIKDGRYNIDSDLAGVINVE
ncbi:MAG: FeoA family protein [Bacillota bacterium]